jgi:Hemerythrin HHE cation binding domain
MNAYDVLFEHHKVLRGHCAKITDIPPDTDERQRALDDLLIELDIHMRIEDDLFYPAVSAATSLVAIAHAEHRQVWDQLAVLLRTPPSAPQYQDEWKSFVTVLDAHATEEERDLCPAPIDLSEDMLDDLGNRMVERIAQLRRSTINKLRVRGRAALLSSL